jgi:hypothetical protein
LAMTIIMNTRVCLLQEIGRSTGSHTDSGGEWRT